MKEKCYLVAFLCCISFYSCHNSDEIKSKIELICSQGIKIPLEEMVSIGDRAGVEHHIDKSALLRMVVYSDTSNCTKCTMNSLYKWNALVHLEDEKQVNFYFIFTPKKGQEHEIQTAYKFSGLNHPIYLDTCNAFLRANPHIPSNPLFHSLLLDENDSVILVGNPVRNKKIEELFFKILEERKDKQDKK